MFVEDPKWFSECLLIAFYQLLSLSQFVTNHMVWIATHKLHNQILYSIFFNKKNKDFINHRSIPNHVPLCTLLPSWWFARFALCDPGIPGIHYYECDIPSNPKWPPALPNDFQPCFKFSQSLSIQFFIFSCPGSSIPDLGQ